MATYTREIRIDGVDFTNSINDAVFSWIWNGGCDKATLRIASAAFDETFGIEQEHPVDIRFAAGAANRWWQGIVEELETNIDGGLTIQCTGYKALLSEVFPSGRFGTDVDTTEPTDITLTEGDADTGAPGVAQTPHLFLVTAIDAEGETLAGVRASGQDGTKISGGPENATITPSAADKKITVTWVASTNGATGYKVYMNPDFGGGTPQKADLLSANGMTVFDGVVGTSFVLDGSVVGEDKDFPFPDDPGDSATSIKATIAGTEIEDIVNYLLDTFLPDEVTKGTIDIGTLNIDLDYYDLQDSSADLQKVLDALVAISGDVQWYVDADATIHFKEKSTTIAVKRMFVIKDVGTVLSTTKNSLVGASKRQTRDGITTVKVVGTETLEQGKDASDTELGVAWDSTTEPTTTGITYYKATLDPRFISASVVVAQLTGNDIPKDSGLTWMESNYPTLQDWLNKFPNWRYVYLHRASLDTQGTLVRRLNGLRTYLGINTPTVVSSRPRIIVRQFAGVRTSLTAAEAAMNWITRKSPNPIRWTLIVENLDSTLLIVPGQGNVRLTTQQGTRYEIPVQSVSYEFDEAVRMTLICGDEEYDANEELDDMRDAVLSSSFRRNSPTKWGEFSE